MKNIKIILIVSLYIVGITACTVSSENPTEEGMDFTNEEAAEDTSEEMVFSEDEVADPETGFDFTEDEADEPASEPGFDFTEDEDPEMSSESGDNSSQEEDIENPNDSHDEDPADPSEEPEEILPPEGTSTWLVTYSTGTIVCEGITQEFGPSPQETITLSLGADGSVIVVQGLGEEAPEIYLFLMDSGPGGSRYLGYLEVTEEMSEVEYEMIFTNTVDPLAADYFFGDIRNETEGCQVNRGISGNRQN